MKLIVDLWSRLKGRWKERNLVPGDSRATGQWGERRAEEFLRNERNHRVVRRNWRHQRDEIDLVTWDGVVLVFSEVRTRRSKALVPGYNSVSRGKKKILRRVCRAYLNQLRVKPRHFRFDIVEVRYAGAEDFEVNHYENVPLFGRDFRMAGKSGE